MSRNHSFDALQPVLVLDDDTELRRMLRRFLEHLGYRVNDAADAAAALALAGADPPCLVIADLMLPHVDGESFVAELREQLGEDTPPIVVLSAAPVREEIARRIGAAASIPKPFPLDDLRDVIWRFAHLHRVRQTGDPLRPSAA